MSPSHGDALLLVSPILRVPVGSQAQLDIVAVHRECGMIREKIWAKRGQHEVTLTRLALMPSMDGSSRTGRRPGTLRKLFDSPKPKRCLCLQSATCQATDHLGTGMRDTTLRRHWNQAPEKGLVYLGPIVLHAIHSHHSRSPYTLNMACLPHPTHRCSLPYIPR